MTNTPYYSVQRQYDCGCYINQWSRIVIDINGKQVKGTIEYPDKEGFPEQLAELLNAAHELKIEKESSVVEVIQKTSAIIDDGRTLYTILAKATEELGELAQEVMIAKGDHYKAPGKDGVIGEAIDVAICMIDMIYNVDPTITEEQIKAIAVNKLAKWHTKFKEIQNNKEANG